MLAARTQALEVSELLSRCYRPCSGQFHKGVGNCFPHSPFSFGVRKSVLHILRCWMFLRAVSQMGWVTVTTNTLFWQTIDSVHLKLLLGMGLNLSISKRLQAEQPSLNLELFGSLRLTVDELCMLKFFSLEWVILRKLSWTWSFF